MTEVPRSGLRVQAVRRVPDQEGPPVEARLRDTCEHIVVRGEMDLATVSGLEELLERTGARPGAVVVVDLCQCSFVDSSVIAALLRAGRGLRDREAELAVILPTGPVRRTFDLTGASDLLRVVEDPPAGSGVPTAGRAALRLLAGGGAED